MKRTVDAILQLDWIGHDHDKEGACDLERAGQQAQRADRLDAVAADGERHRTEGAERRKPHDEAERQLRYYTEPPQAAVAS